METPLPSSSSQPAQETSSGHVTSRHMALALPAAGLITLLGDFLFWKHSPGISLALYFCAVAGVVIAMHRHKWDNITVCCAAALMLGTACATALQISFTNISVLIALLAVICGECWYGELPGGWARWSEPLVAWLAAPARWPWLGRLVRRTRIVGAVFSTENRGNLSRMLRMVAPAVCLAWLFAIVLGMGNAVFSDMIRRFLDQFDNNVSQYDFSMGHLLFWLAFATLALAWTLPRPAPLRPRLWARVVPRITRGDATVAVWQSRLVLIVLNALFFAVNTIDVFYLWNRTELPGGVSFSEFVHDGVYSLIFAVLLSAVVITLIFQQEEKITRSRFLKVLAMLWIGQNLAQIAGVFLRLKLYVEAYELSELRIYTGYFLLLVAAGFGLLAWHVIRGGRLNRLIFRCTLAAFTLFFFVQFTDDAGVVARYNVARWKHGHSHALDVAYLASLGPGAWPSIVEVAAVTDKPDTASAQARACLQAIAGDEEIRVENFDWRSWQARHDRLSAWLIQASKKLPPSPGVPSTDQNNSQSATFSR